MAGRKRNIKPNFKPPEWLDDSDPDTDTGTPPKHRRLHPRESESEIDPPRGQPPEGDPQNVIA